MESTLNRQAAGLASFRCMDAQEQARLLPGWNQRYFQLSHGVFEGALRAVSVDGAELFLESANQALFQRGSLEAGSLGIAIPVRLGGTAKFCGRNCSINQVYVYSGRSGFEFCSPAGHQVAGISLSPAAVAALRLQAGESFPSLWLAAAHTQDADPAALFRVRTFVSSLLEATAATPAVLENLRSRESLMDTIAAHLINLLTSGLSLERAACQPHRRSKLVACAQERIEAQPEEPVSVATLCRELAVSRRTLQYCFQDVLGVSPNTYLRAIRLNGARAALRSASSVTAAALDWGFWHLGQFAADYRLMFGELPSQTFQRVGGKMTTEH